ncbi:type II secretion system F family protein [Sphingomonas sp. ASV193]|uniref:type II secretion system F family protein n=1 Tax=Sphingomonas sp. ASV193 TaxID=3144405 RepID=UPI0032E8D39B
MTPALVHATVLVLVFGGTILLVETLVRYVGRTMAASSAINQRLQLIGSGKSREETLRLLRDAPADLSMRLPERLKPLGLKLESLIVRAQLPIAPQRLFAIILLAPIGLFLATVALVVLFGGTVGFGRLVIILAFSGALGLALPVMAIRFVANRTRRKMEEQFPVALDVFVRGLRAGHPIAGALDMLTNEMPDPIGSQFGIVVDEVTYGADLRDALMDMANRWDMEDIRMFVVSLSVQSETGGNLAEVLENLSRVIRDRASMMMKVRALSSEGRMTAAILTILPVLTFVVLFVFNPEFFLDVADDGMFIPGFAMLITLYFIGFFWIRKLIDLKV